MNSVSMREARRALQAEHRRVELLGRRDQRGVAHRSGAPACRIAAPQGAAWRKCSSFSGFSSTSYSGAAARRTCPPRACCWRSRSRPMSRCRPCSSRCSARRRRRWFFFVVVDPLLLGAWVWLVLELYGKPERFLQTATAVFGTGAVLGARPVPAAAADRSPRSARRRPPALAQVARAAAGGRCSRSSPAASSSSPRTPTCSPASPCALTYFLLVNLLVGLLRGPGA